MVVVELDRRNLGFASCETFFAFHNARSLSMAPTTGKRKRGEALADPSHDSESPLGECSSIKAQALFQQHYEARFLPLEDFGPQQNTANDIGPDTVSDDIESGSEWEGFSEGDEPRADVVQYTTSALSRVDIPKDELKTFMVRLESITAYHY